MKKIIVLFSFIFFLLNANAQGLTEKGFAIQALYVDNKSGNPEDDIAVDQCFIVSFTDETLAHVIYQDGVITNAQLYKIVSEKPYKEGEITLYKFVATSGVSGSKYSYEIRLNVNGGLKSFTLIQPDGKTKDVFKGIINSLKTFKQ